VADSAVVPSFEIRELTGQQRRVVLTARGLPYRPFTLSGKQRVEVTWYPGNPEGTGTVLGAAEDSTTLNGYWKDLYLASGGTGAGGTPLAPIIIDGRQVTTAKAAIQALDDIRRQGQELEVTWDEITRRGYLSQLKQDWHTVHDIAWTATFEWISLGEATSPAVLDGTSTSDASQQMSTQMNQLQTVSIPPFSVPPAFEVAIDNALAQSQAAVDSITNANTVQAQGATTPEDATRRTFAACNDVVSATVAVTQVIDAQPARTLVSGGDPALPSPALLSLGEVVAAETFVRTASIAARKLQRTAAIQRASLARQMNNTLIGVWQSSAGDDLRDVSDRFYGTRLQWRPIMLFNELTSTALAAGQLVLVPRAAPGTV
jgi:hypothetical protein